MLKTLQSDLQCNSERCKGEFTTTLHNKNCGTQSKFLVIQGKMDSPPLQSKSTLLELGMLKSIQKEHLKKPCPVPYHLQKPLKDWAKEGLRIYLLGAPRFRIVTAHKPLVPLFNKVKSNIPPRIEKWIMEM